jgi:beta-glucosidase
MHDAIDHLVNSMTLEEKVSLLAGASAWETVPIERLGIPSLKVTDGPNGVRGSSRDMNDVTSAAFPVEICLAATWNPELVERIGQALAQETKFKGAQVLLAPTVNIQRTPLGGRNFECFSEDPYLTSRLGVAYIRGVQSQGVGATVKHYICNDAEFERNTISSDVDERTLREIYLPPFKAAVKEAGSWAVMASYNKLNGTYASENPSTLTEILKREWDFDGIVMSDWFGTRSTVASINAGLDLEMPGPAIWRGEKLPQAVERGEVTVGTLDESVRRLLRLFERTGILAEHYRREPEQAVDLPEHRALIREAAAEGIVLLKNDHHVLPLQRKKLQSIAVIGPNAKTARIMGGGSASVNAHYAVTPYEGIKTKVGDSVEVGYELGCTNYMLLPPLDTNLISPDGKATEHGLTVSYFNNADLSGQPVYTTVAKRSVLNWFGQIPEGVNPQQFSVCESGRFTPQETGTYTFGLVSSGLSRLYIDGQEVIDNWTHRESGEAFHGRGSAEVELAAGRGYELSVAYCNDKIPGGALYVGCLPPIPADTIELAAKLAAQSDVALVFVGLSDEWESEGADRSDMNLVGEQDELIEQVAAANENTIVVLNTGSPITMPWLDKVAAVVEAWYLGQENGNAIADILFGDAAPSGKLPQTFPVRLEDTPAYINYPGEYGHVLYGERVFVGYRCYDTKKIRPLFPFGFGLSYTTFSYSPLRMSAQEIGPDDTLLIELDVTNTGQRTGKEIVQLYLHDVEASVQRPEKELKAFAKVQLAPGERKTVTLKTDREALAFYDEAAHEWVAEAGKFEALVGSSSQDIHSTATFALTSTSRFGGRPKKEKVLLDLSSTLAQFVADEGARAILNSYLPGMLEAPEASLAMGLTLEQIAGFIPDILTSELIQRIGKDLEQLGQ